MNRVMYAVVPINYEYNDETYFEAGKENPVRLFATREAANLQVRILSRKRARRTDYLPIHKFLDQSKLYVGDNRHRCLLHNTLGVALCEQFFGEVFTRADGQKVSTRSVAEQHILEDLGCIPTPADFMREMPIRTWFSGFTRQQKEQLQGSNVGAEC